MRHLVVNCKYDSYVRLDHFSIVNIRNINDISTMRLCGELVKSLGASFGEHILGQMTSLSRSFEDNWYKIVQ